MRSRSGNLLLLAASLLLAILLAEPLLRLAIPSADRYDVWEPGFRIVFRPIPGVMPGVSGDARFFVNSEGLRGDEPDPAHRMVLLVLGGSTTECLYLDQEEAWPMQLQTLLSRHYGFPVRVGNAGKSGMTSLDHVLHMRHLLPRLDQVQTVLVLAGVNDLAMRLEQDDAFDPNPPENPDHAFSLVAPEASRPWQRTGWFRLCKRLHAKKSEQVNRALIYSIGGDSYDGWRQRRAMASSWRDTPPDLEPALRSYEGDIVKMARMARDEGKRIIFLTQPALWRRDLSPEEERLLWFGWIGDRSMEGSGPYYTAGALRSGIDTYNARLLAVCNREQLECFDLAGRIPSTTAAFYDDVHFNENGSAMAARAILEHLTHH